MRQILLCYHRETVSHNSHRLDIPWGLDTLVLCWVTERDTGLAGQDYLQTGAQQGV